MPNISKEEIAAPMYIAHCKVVDLHEMGEVVNRIPFSNLPQYMRRAWLAAVDTIQGLLDQQQETYLTAEEAAQRLRELSNPDCVYTLCADDSPTPQTLESACGGAVWYLGDDGKGAYPKFCHHCGGAVRDAT